MKRIKGICLMLVLSTLAVYASHEWFRMRVNQMSTLDSLGVDASAPAD